MLRSVASKVMWLVKGAALFWGAALTLALVLGVASMAFGANGGNFILGKLNNAATKVTGLTGNVNGAAMQVVNNNADANDTALSLNVQSGEAPMRVNSATKVTNLNADKLDGKEAPLLASIDGVSGLPQSSPDVATTASTRWREGVYVVPFNRDVTRCHRVVTLGERPSFTTRPESAPHSGEAVTANVSHVSDPTKKILVAIRDSAGALNDRSFYLAVFC